ncbi:hypothetical protein NCLIV_024590 [Neospora caninum Liverpool]|uniref:NECAP PHear domain-containing protein n=1 Tax=Neospora caninum (strain Liverpool) TaxID=572307 RepID=F0VG27_NEOCL|nr:hypothetical protein NCLIV_024590 [Neospora caninum Liverpool]CBZ52671.1 hypothetical protein NCLIV_024590 [Neospora caninum Liverpool]|eukprot:XP_003882703.1 hypothetical protein NCLIV_024590 [Neospora caninum Liverpool]
MASVSASASKPVQEDAYASTLENRDEDEALEFIVYSCRQVTVYKIPPRTPQGHRAENWKDVLWTGKLQVASKGRKCSIRLVDRQTGNLFAACPLPEKHEEAVERAVDSSRYFVVRLDNGKGRRAYVGVSFADRNDAFDFTCALNDEERAKSLQAYAETTSAESQTASPFSGLLPPPPENTSREGQEPAGYRLEGSGISSDSFSFEFTDFQRGE